MRYEAHLFDFPGRRFAFRHADATDAPYASQVAALRAIAEAVEPTVVDVSDEANVLFHLVGGDGEGGSYIRAPERTRTVERIDAAALVGWFDEVSERGAHWLDEVSICDGWFGVDARAGDVLQLDEHRGHYTVPIVEHRGGAAVRGPGSNVLVPPFAARLLMTTGELDFALHWSAWTDADGVGHGRFQRMFAALAAAGWVLASEPDVAELAWRSWTKKTVTPLPVRAVPPAPAPSPVANVWSAFEGGRVVLGISAAARDALVGLLVVADREVFEDSGSLGFHRYDEAKRTAEIRAGLATSLGRAEVDVAAFEIMAQPVTTEMWIRYAAQTGAMRPAAWSVSGTPPANDPVAGVSPDEAAAFAAHHGWTLPSEAEWQHAANAGALDRLESCEYTRDAFTPFPDADESAFDAVAAGLRGQSCARGDAPRVPLCLEGRRGVAHDHRFKFARFRGVRRAR